MWPVSGDYSLIISNMDGRKTPRPFKARIKEGPKRPEIIVKCEMCWWLMILNVCIQGDRKSSKDNKQRIHDGNDAV